MLTLKEQVERANAKRRTRLLCYIDCYKASLKVLLGDVVYKQYHGGHVANAYKYPAYATSFLVRKCADDVVRYIVKQASARKGSTGMGEYIKGDKLTNSCEGEVITLHEVVHALTQQEFAEHTPKYVLLDFLVDKGVISAEKASLLIK